MLTTSEDDRKAIFKFIHYLEQLLRGVVSNLAPWLDNLAVFFAKSARVWTREKWPMEHSI